MSYKDEYRSWMDSPAISNSEWEELKAIADDEKEIESRFFAPLEFGTAGLRGIMGMGLNRMNVHVIRHATQGFATVIKNEGEEACKKGIAICYDCRNNSPEFAREAASVMAGNGIFVRLFESMRPTPELSFAIMHYDMTAGINVTASHNPKEYNGYKVYWSDGAQLPPQHAETIANEMINTDIFGGITYMDFEEAKSKGLIVEIGEECDEAFLKCVLGQSISSEIVEKVADDFKIVYTPFHGTGFKLVPEALKRLGVKHIVPVPEQMISDGNFPTVSSPNPENPEGFELAIKLAKEVSSDLIIGTDPDADRVGVMVRSTTGDYVGISGNQMGVLLLDYIIESRKAKGILPKNAAFIKTIVTTSMAQEVAAYHGVHVDNTFTGFKFMAEKLAEYKRDDSYEYVLAYEESYGYMMGDYVRDKDAVTASMLIAEMAAYYFDMGMTLYDAMENLYVKYGYFAEQTLNLVMPGLDGLDKMKNLMATLRTTPPTHIGDVPVIRVRDYSSGTITVPTIGIVDKTEIKGSNVLYFDMSDGTSFIVRPSGTEPKVKVYILAKGTDKESCSATVAKYIDYAESLKN